MGLSLRALSANKRKKRRREGRTDYYYSKPTPESSTYVNKRGDYFRRNRRERKILTLGNNRFPDVFDVSRPARRAVRLVYYRILPILIQKLYVWPYDSYRLMRMEEFLYDTMCIHRLLLRKCQPDDSQGSQNLRVRPTRLHWHLLMKLITCEEESSSAGQKL